MQAEQVDDEYLEDLVYSGQVGELKFPIEAIDDEEVDARRTKAIMRFKDMTRL